MNDGFNDGVGAWPSLPPRLTQAELDAYLLHAARCGATDVCTCKAFAPSRSAVMAGWITRPRGGLNLAR
ncbi:MAG: hypothetical protein IPK53_10655 [bacterium]|nr:hypothetical protein [bacterium]